MRTFKIIATLAAGLALSLPISEAASARILVVHGPHCIQGVNCCVPGKPCWIK